MADHDSARCKGHINQIGMRVGRIIEDFKKSALPGKTKTQMCNDMYVPLGMMGHTVDRFIALRRKHNVERKQERRKKNAMATKAKAKAKCAVKPATRKQAAAAKAAIKTAAPPRLRTRRMGNLSP